MNVPVPAAIFEWWWKNDQGGGNAPFLFALLSACAPSNRDGRAITPSNLEKLPAAFPLEPLVFSQLPRVIAGYIGKSSLIYLNWSLGVRLVTIWQGPYLSLVPT